MEDYLENARTYVAAIPEIGAIYGSIIGNPVAAAFCSAIVIVFVFGAVLLLMRLIRLRWGARLVSIVPSTLATLGVLGTFTGILLGLLDFDVAKIDESIPRLLGGLTVAFSTSIVGMGSALLFRILDALIPGRSNGVTATADDLHDLLKAMQKDNQTNSSSLIDALSDRGPIASMLAVNGIETEKHSTLMATGLADIRNALSSDSDSSLVTQIQKLRSTVQDGQNDLIREFRDFAKHMTENTNKVLIEALQDVIRDFNDKITEQFGENFKQLNQAVGALLVWQENYKQFVETTEQRISTAVAALESSEKAIGSVKEHSAAIPAAIALLTPPLIAINEQSNTLAKHLEAVGGLRDKAFEAFPVIEQNLKTMTEDFSEHVKDAVATTKDALETQRSANDDLSKRFAELSEESTKSQKAFSLELEKTLGNMAEQTNSVFAKHTQLIQESSDEVQRHVSEVWKRTEAANDALNSQYSQLSEQTTNSQKTFSAELERALGKMNEETNAAFTQHTQLLDQSAKEVQRQIADAWKRTEESINGRMETLDQEIQKELQRTLTVMGNNLASVSEKFVNDYTPLTERLREVVQIAQRAS